MKRHILPSALVVVAIVLSSALGGASTAEGPAAAKGPLANGSLYSDAAETGVALSDPAGVVIRSRAVRVDAGLLASDRLSLSLFGGTTVHATADKVGAPRQGKRLWLGHVDGSPDSSVILAANRGAVAGTIRVGDALYKLIPSSEGGHALAQVVAHEPLPEAGPIPVTGRADRALSLSAAVAGDDGSTIDVLVVYTPASRNRYGANGILSLIDTAVAEANQSYANSLIETQLRLVQSAEVDYVESGSMSTDLSRLRGTSDGYMDEIHTLRNAYGADLVSLIEESGDYCGIAYLMSYLSTSFASSAFSVVYSSCATGYYSFAHELGHNMGSHHDRANAGSALFPYSYGYWAPDESWRTVMAYNCTSGCTRIQYFSNPDVLYGGVPMGVDHDVDPVNSADNARSINEAKWTVANFRAAAPLDPPAVPSDLVATAASESSIELTWIDHAENEDSFAIERVKGGGGWSQIDSVGQNVTGYVDSGLEADTLYSYRVWAHNGAGDSDYSNVDSATTHAPPDFVDQVATADIPVGGTVSGSYVDTQSDGQGVQTLTERDSGGKPSKRYSWLEHKWTFQVQPGTGVDLHTNAWATDSSDGDLFVFAYSTDDAKYEDLVTVGAASDDGSYLVGALPADSSGTVYIRLRDTDRTEGNRPKDTVSIDHMYIRTQLGAVERPAAPTGLSATAVSSSQIDLAWTDNASNETSYDIERRGEAADWALAGTAGMNATTYSDVGLDPETPYVYRVQAHNSAGESESSNTAGATTEAIGPALHVGDLDGVGEAAKNKWDATVTVTVHNEGHIPVAGATVDGAWSAGATGSGECVTAGDGTCTIAKQTLKSNVDSVTFTVDAVSLAGYDFDPTANHDTEADSDGTRVVVLRP